MNKILVRRSSEHIMRPLCLHKAVKMQPTEFPCFQGLLDSPETRTCYSCIHCIVYTFTSFCMTICIQILLILLYLKSICLSESHYAPLRNSQNQNCIIIHNTFRNWKASVCTNLWPLEQIEQILSQVTMHVLLRLNPNRELHVTERNHRTCNDS